MSTPNAHEYHIITMIYRLATSNTKKKEVDFISICSCEFESKRMNERTKKREAVTATVK